MPKTRTAFGPVPAPQVEAGPGQERWTLRVKGAAFPVLLRTSRGILASSGYPLNRGTGRKTQLSQARLKATQPGLKFDLTHACMIEHARQ